MHIHLNSKQRPCNFLLRWRLVRFTFLQPRPYHPSSARAGDSSTSGCGALLLWLDTPGAPKTTYSYSGSKANTRVIPEIMFCKILLFMWSVGADTLPVLYENRLIPFQIRALEFVKKQPEEPTGLSPKANTVRGALGERGKMYLSALNVWIDSWTWCRIAAVHLQCWLHQPLTLTLQLA